jgi:hypothetical protein
MRTTLPAATSNRAVLLHTQRVFPWRHGATCSGQNNFKRHLTRSCTPPCYSLWGSMKGAANKDNPHTPLELKESFADFIWKIPPVELSCLCKQDKTCRCASTSTWGPIANICFNLSKYEKCISIHLHGLWICSSSMPGAHRLLAHPA